MPLVAAQHVWCRKTRRQLQRSIPIFGLWQCTSVFRSVPHTHQLMNGVRRFLGGGAVQGLPSEPGSSPPTSNTSPLAVTGKPSWSPSAPANPSSKSSGSPSSNLGTAAQGLFIRKDKQKPLPPSTSQDVGSSSTQPGRSGTSISSFKYPSRNQTTSSPATSSPKRLPGSLPNSPNAGPTRAQHRKSSTQTDKRTSGLLNNRDELLMSLLASEAVVDSRDFEVLSAEDVEDLKRVGVKWF